MFSDNGSRESFRSLRCWKLEAYARMLRQWRRRPRLRDLTGKISMATRKTSRSYSCGALVALEAGQNPGIELLNSVFRSWDVTDLPPRKWILLIVLRARNQNQYTCSLSGRAFANYRALGGHKAHHAIKECKKRAYTAMEEKNAAAVVAGRDNRALVVCEEPPPFPAQRSCGGRRCLSFGRAFSSVQTLVGHKSHCKEPAAPENEGKQFSNITI